jgi:arginine decarboxylase
VLVRYSFEVASKNRLDVLQRYLGGLDDDDLACDAGEELSARLGRVISDLRPELDLYLVADAAIEDVVGASTQAFRRIFYRQDDYMELHLSILRGISERFETPFFTALKKYAKRPTGVFHALPISRGTSVTKSHWIHDMVDFYGINIFLAETSATTGGLDSLLNPLGPLKKAQELAAKTFGAERTFFVTNGTSTANKIVVQAVLRPDDIVLVDRDCHKSHHYGLVLSGAKVCYLDSYPLPEYSIYGAVPLSEITARLLEYQRAGLLHRVKMLLLTNCTFDGIVYNVEMVMRACLAIKPDLIFLWDEAWFAFAGFHPTYRQRTARYVARKLLRRYRSPDYRAQYAAWLGSHDAAARAALLAQGQGMPDPDRVRIRVYATQSTHKTLTAFRQASMIHVHDQDFQGKVATAFHEAYMTHTSTSPNYQLLASLDIGRRQVALEGFELVQKQIERAMTLRERVKETPVIAKYLKFLSMRDLIPAAYRGSGIEVYYDEAKGWSGLEEAWNQDEFVLDPSRLTLHTGQAGIDGYGFRGQVLMDKYAIQINKTSRNTVLFMTNIGTTRSAVAYLLTSLASYCSELDAELDSASDVERQLQAAKVTALMTAPASLPGFSAFHESFRRGAGLDGNATATQDGDIRSAYFRGHEDDDCSYLNIAELSDVDVDALAPDIVSAMFVIPYPPGFPMLVPGQIVTPDIVHYLRQLDVKEIHGYRPELGLRIFRPQALASSALP